MSAVTTLLGTGLPEELQRATSIHPDRAPDLGPATECRGLRLV
jgi:hypothetical protein